MTEVTECALWYWRHFGLHYDIRDTEEAAADFAVFLQDQGDGVPIGVQFADGRTVRLNDWPAYRQAQAKARATEEEWAARRRNQPPKPTRKIKDPFEGTVLTVEADEPEWLGTPTP